MEDGQVETHLVQGIRLLAERRENYIAELFGRLLHLAFYLRDECDPCVRVVCRRERERKAKPEPAVIQLDSREKFQVHRDDLIRPQIADGQIHDAIAVLLRQGRKRAFRNALFVFFSGVFGRQPTGSPNRAVVSETERG
jgi:hypothetical protein